MEGQVRYGLVGTGMMGVEHLNNLAITPGAVVTAIADPTERSLGWAKKALGDRGEGVQSFASSAELAKSGLVDAVIVASPNYTHRDVLTPLFGEGLAILCEKPLATTIPDARWVVEQAEASARPFWTAMEYRYMPPAPSSSRRCTPGASVACRCSPFASIASRSLRRSPTGTASAPTPAARWWRNAATSST